MFDLEIDSHGFILTRNQRFLRSYDAARAAFAGQAGNLQRVSAADDGHLGRQARQTVQAGNSYLHDYSVPLMDTERIDPASARCRVVSGEGLEHLRPAP